MDEVELMVGIRSSEDGVTWGTPSPFPSDATWSSTSGWGASSAFVDPNTCVTEYPFYQVGVFARNTTSDGVSKLTSARVRVESTEVAPSTVVTGLQPVSSNGSTSTAMFFALTPAMVSANIHALRVSLEKRLGTGSIRFRFALQVSDDREEWLTADIKTVSGLDGQVSADGLTAGSSFVDVRSALTKKFVRAGVQVTNTSGTDLEACLAGLRIDIRGAE